MFTVLLMICAADTPPNLVVVVTDEHNFRTLGCYRETLPRERAEIWGLGAVVDTPHLDRIAHEGVIATRAYATSPVCTPSRAAMFTGLHPQHTGSPSNDLPMRDNVPTLARELNEHGYVCGYAGKWHLDGDGKPQWEPERDFGFTDNRFMFNRGHWKKLTLGTNGPAVGATNKSGQPNYKLNGADAETFTTDFLTDRAIDFIDQHAGPGGDGKPFCYVISIPDPHGPNAVRPPYDTLYSDTALTPPRTFGRRQNPRWIGGGGKYHNLQFKPGQMALYFGMVKCIDDNVGRLLAKLSEVGALDNTLLVMTSDHGDLCYEHDLLNKGNPYEGSARIPLLMRLPGKIPAGSVLSSAVGTVDFTPTWLGLLDHPTRSQMQGRDLSEWLTGQEEPSDDPIVLRQGGTKSGWVAAVDSRHKLILSGAEVPWLFDAALDPDELSNSIEQDPAAAKRLAEALKDHHAAHTEPRLESGKLADALASLLEN